MYAACLRHLRVYGQMTAQGCLVFGGRGAPHHLGSWLSDRDARVDKVHAKVTATLLEFFPALADARITRRLGRRPRRFSRLVRHRQHGP